MYATRLRKHTVDEHDLVFSRIFHWTDSVTVLHWLHSSHKRQTVFVANRVAEIIETSIIDEWKQVQGTVNPADIGTRGMQIKDLEEIEWITGPAWLRDKTDEWPEQPPVFDLDNNSTDIEEAANLANKPPCVEKLVIDWSWFSSWNGLMNTIAFSLTLRTKTRTKSLTTDERKIAQSKSFMLIQQENFSDDYRDIKKESRMRKASNLSRFVPFLNNQGVLRVKGRLKHSNLAYERKQPILLTARHNAVQLMLQAEHKMNHHEGTEYVRSVLKQKLTYETP